MDTSPARHDPPATCPGCRGEFVCRIRAGYSTCWCFDLPRVCAVDPDADCLCPNCLQERIAAAAHDHETESTARTEFV